MEAVTNFLTQNVLLVGLSSLFGVISWGLIVIGIASIIYKVVPTPKDDEVLNFFQKGIHWVVKVIGYISLNKK